MLKRINNRLKLASHVLLHGNKNINRRENIPAITPEEVAEAKTFFHRDKFFIFGHARSGTTLLNRLIRLHPEVHCNYQGHFFTRPPLLQSLVDNPEVEEWFTRHSNRWNRGKDISPVVLRSVVDFLMEREAAKEGKHIVGDKSPNNLLNGEAVRLLHNIYPDAKLIFIVRDGRDAALSHRFQAFIDATQHLNKADLKILNAFGQNAEQFRAPNKSLFTTSGIKQAAEDWAFNVTSTHLEGRKRFGNQYLHLRFEDLLANPEAEMHRVWGFLGADTSIPDLNDRIDTALNRNIDAAWQKEKAGQMATEIPKGQAGSWREYFSKRDIKAFKAAAGEILVQWGYEENVNW
jgi:hypothetical protein